MIGVYHIKSLFGEKELNEIKAYYSDVSLDDITVRESNIKYYDKKWYNRSHIDYGANVLHLCAQAKDLPLSDKLIIDTANAKFRREYKHDGTLNIIRYDVGGESRLHYDGAGKFTGNEYTFIGMVDDGFTGGEFVINNEVIHLEKGDALIFQINYLHCVKPVIEGVRVSVVARLLAA